MKMMGDVLTSSLLCSALKTKYPLAKLHFLVNANTVPVVLGHPDIDELIIFKPDDGGSMRSFWRFIKTIKQQKYDHVYDAYCKTQSNLISLFSGASVRVSYYKWYSSWCYSQTIRRRQHASTPAGLAIENRLRLIYKDAEISERIYMPKIYISDQERAVADQLLTKAGLGNKNLVMISALGSHDNKTLPLPFMARILDHVVSHNSVELLFNYLPQQQAQAEQLYDLCQPETQQHIHLQVFADSLRGFLALLNRCQGIIGNEGGAINMGKALSLSSFSIYAPWIDPAGWGIFEDGQKHQSVHLQDYNATPYGAIPYEDVEMKKLKGQAGVLYQQLKPELFFNQLLEFYETNNYFQASKG